MKPYWSPFAVIIVMFSIIFGAMPSAPASAAPLAATQLELQRRAAQLIEDQRVSGMTLKWGTARLGTARTLFRPDLATPAYVEFSVFSGTTPAGFIVLSTGTHDFPITHWNDQGEAPSTHLARLAQSKGQAIARLYKIDALTYAAENSGGQLIGLYPPKSRLPNRITGQTPAMLDQTREPTHEEWNSTSDDEENPGTHVHTQTGPSWNSAIKLSGWQSWAQFKAGFAGSYQTLILALTREADHDWDIDVAAAESGEGVVAGLGCRPIAALFGGVQASLSGPGAPFLRATVRQRQGLTPVIELCSVGTPPQGGRAAQLTLSYSNGKSEVLRFVALRQSDVEGASPSASSTDGRSRNAAPLHSKSLQSNWSAWTYYWAGDSGDQRYYDQIDANTYNNTTSCYSGCGATAWAMLVGWADYQAHNGNAYWAGRTGLYRTNGGTTGSATVAPSSMDTGVRNITMEIRYDVNTFCALGSGATYPGDMDGVGNYLSGRTATDEDVDYDPTGIPLTWLREDARNAIRDDDTPAIIGTGWLSHYPLAWGYAWQSRTVQIAFWETTEYNRDFWVNQGWGGSGDGWVNASTWFSGELNP